MRNILIYIYKTNKDDSHLIIKNRQISTPKFKKGKNYDRNQYEENKYFMHLSCDK